MAGGEIQISELRKTYAGVTAVDGISLEMPPGEFFSMLGPSGCGKTTTLRMIAGFVTPTSGRILLDGTDMARTPPHRRNVNTVFQSYALFPHLNVQDNVAFGLRRQKVAKSEIGRRVGEALELVQLSGMGKRKPAQLSGGQQQRVALARALILNPSVLLLDEPLGALDAKLRKQLQVELKALQAEVGITFVYVTHDQDEALTMSDRIAVMSEGKVEHVGSPREVYEEPATAFVADFVGVSNLMEASADGRDGDGCRLRLGDFSLLAGQGDLDAKGQVTCVIRPERVRLEPYGQPSENRVSGMVERLVYLGDSVQLIVRLATGQTIQALIQNDGSALPYNQGTPVLVHLPAAALRVLRGIPAGRGTDRSAAQQDVPEDRDASAPAAADPALDEAGERDKR